MSLPLLLLLPLLNDAISGEVTARLAFIYFICCGQNAKLLILPLMRGCGSSVSSISWAEQTLAGGGAAPAHLHSERGGVFLLTRSMMSAASSTPS